MNKNLSKKIKSVRKTRINNFGTDKFGKVKERNSNDLANTMKGEGR